VLEVAEREVMESSVARVHALVGFWRPFVFSCESGSVRKARETGARLTKLRLVRGG